jgi:hypothetical protein
LQNDGTMDIYVVNSTVQTVDECEWQGPWWRRRLVCTYDDTWAYDSDLGWHEEKSIPDSESVYATGVTFPSDCSLAFFEDNLWVSGEVNGKITIASAADSGTTHAYLQNDITYTPGDGIDDGFTLIVEDSILISPHIGK